MFLKFFVITAKIFVIGGEPVVPRARGAGFFTFASKLRITARAFEGRVRGLIMLGIGLKVKLSIIGGISLPVMQYRGKKFRTIGETVGVFVIKHAKIRRIEHY